MDGGYRDTGDLVHFRENRSSTLTELGDRWESGINSASYSPISALTPPTATMTKSSGTYYLTAQSGFSDYKWVNASSLNINNVVHSGQTFTTSSSSSYACYVKNGSGHWSLSPTLYTSCGSCRIATKAWDETELGIQTNAFPNPTDGDFTVQFTIPARCA